MRTKNILVKAQKLHYSLADLKKKIKIRQRHRKYETLSKMSFQQNLITFYNPESQIHPLNEKNLSRIESIKAKLDKIKFKSSLRSCFNICDKRFMSKNNELSLKLIQQDDQIVSTYKDKNAHFAQNLSVQKIYNLDFDHKKLEIRDFHKLRRLESGVYGAFSLYRHKISNFLTAIKIISKSKLNLEYHNYLTRQIKLQTFAYHPNIAQIYTFFDDADFIYLALEFSNHGNLYDLAQKEGGKLSQDKVKKYMRNICQAVSLLHKNNIIHRDLKPENILVSNGVAKLCDFGWAVRAIDLRDTLCGTPLYSSPQLIKNEHYDRKIDIWSIGVMTYEFVYGRGPFDIRSRDELYKVVEKEVEFGEELKVSKECKDFIKACLEKDPSDRPEIWQLLSQGFLKGEEKIRDLINVSVVQNTNSEK